MNKSNKKLAIVIPTYNRCDFLDKSLEYHISILEAHNIEIHISDNASTDFTEKTVKKWIEQYPNLKYWKNNKTISPDMNFEKALTLAQTEYVWLIGDTYKIPENAIDVLIQKISQNDKYDAIITNLPSRTIKDSHAHEEEIYIDCNKLLIDLGAVMSAMGCLIYSSDLLKNATFDRYRGSHYIQTGIIFEYIANVDFKVLHLPAIVMTILEPKKKLKVTWSLTEKVYEYAADGWVNFIYSLPVAYNLNSKIEACKKYRKTSGNFTLKSFLAMRVTGALKLRLLLQHKYSIKQIAGLHFYTGIIISLIPRKLISSAASLYFLARKIKSNYL